jgi:hypothetical protein
MSIESEEEDRDLKNRLRAYWISSAFATIVYSLTLFFCLVGLPVGTHREWLLVLLVCLVLLTIPLMLGLWRYIKNREDFPMGCATQLMGALVLLEFVFCLIQVISLSMLIHRLAALGTHVQ